MTDNPTNIPILVCDVDGVVVDLSKQWWEWLVGQSDFNDDPCPIYEDVKKYYDYSIPFNGLVEKDVAYHFWKRELLYDEAMPVEGSQKAVETFKQAGWDIVFASHCEGIHSKSKWEFLKRNFPVDSFMATREKHFLRANIAIDDRAENLVKFPMDVFCVLMDAPHNKDVDEESLGLHRLHSLNEDTAEFLIKYWWKYYAK